MNTQNSHGNNRKTEPGARVTGTVFFMDGTRLVLQWPRQAGDNPSDVGMNVRKALEAERILADVDGALVLIPVRNIKYVHVYPAPGVLPPETIVGATLLE